MPLKGKLCELVFLEKRNRMTLSYKIAYIYIYIYVYTLDTTKNTKYKYIIPEMDHLLIN